MITKAEFDLKAGDTIYICDRCERHTKPFMVNNDDKIYCDECYDHMRGMGDLAAEREDEDDITPLG